MELIRNIDAEKALVTIDELEVLPYSTVTNSDLWKDLRSLGTRHLINWWLAELSHHEKFEAWLSDTRKRVAQIAHLNLPNTNIQVLGESGSGKSMFMRGLIALIDGKRTYQRGHTIFKARGAATLSAPINFSDEQNTPANDICRVLKPKRDNRPPIKMQIAHRGTDLTGAEFPHTLFFNNCNLVASCPTAEFFDFETDSGTKSVEHYKALKKPHYYRPPRR